MQRFIHGQIPADADELVPYPQWINQNRGKQSVGRLSVGALLSLLSQPSDPSAPLTSNTSPPSKLLANQANTAIDHPY